MVSGKLQSKVGDRFAVKRAPEIEKVTTWIENDERTGAEKV